MTRATLHEAAEPFLPDTPTFNLVEEPWIDIVGPDGEPQQVGLGRLLRDGHHLQLDDTRLGLLWRHATQRFVIALAYLVHAEAPRYEWQSVANGDAALPGPAVDAVLERLQDHLYLHHPKTPFLQTPSVLREMRAKRRRKKDTDESWLENSTDSVWTLFPDVPSKSNTAWFGRQEGQDEPDIPTVAAGLLLRHYFALPGNETPNNIADTKRSEGGATGLTHHGRSFVTIPGSSVANMAARNLLKDWLDKVTSASTWFDGTTNRESAQAHLNDDLWLYTASSATTMVIPSTAGVRVIRTPAPWPRDSKLPKQVSTLAAKRDPHALRVAPKSSAAKKEGYSHIRLDATGTELDLVHRYYNDLIEQGGAGLRGPSVLARRSLAYNPPGRTPTAALVIEGAGSATGPRVAAATLFRPLDGSLTADETKAEWYAERSNRIQGHGESVAGHVGTAVLVVLGSRSDAGIGGLSSEIRNGVYRRVRHQVAQACEPILRRQLHTAVTSASDDLPVGLDEDDIQSIRAAAVDTFESLVAPYTTRPSSIEALVRARRSLNAKLTTTLEQP